MADRSSSFLMGTGKRPLYHGSRYAINLKPGDIIRPSTHPQHPEGKSNSISRDMEVDRDVEEYMYDRDNDEDDEYEDDDRTEDEVREEYADYASHHWDNAWASPNKENALSHGRNGATYQVEHLNPATCAGCNHPYDPDQDDHTDREGFRVVKKIQ